jgi:hypothetical protein
VEVPKGTLEDAAKRLKGEEMVLFLSFVKKMLKMEARRKK